MRRKKGPKQGEREGPIFVARFSLFRRSLGPPNSRCSGPPNIPYLDIVLVVWYDARMEKNEVISAKNFDIPEVLRLLERGYNVYEVCQKLGYDRASLVAFIKSDETLFAAATDARRQGADALVATYKDMLMREIQMATGADTDPRVRVSLIKELGAHIRWEAQSVHSGTYATKVINEHAGGIEHKTSVKLSPEQVQAMAEEVLAQARGHDFTDPRAKTSTH